MNEIALVLPCYNESKRLKINQLNEFIKDQYQLVDFYFVDDGSTDDTVGIITNNLLEHPNSFLIQLKRNYGKGNAVRNAVLQCCNLDYKYFGFIDADLDIPLHQVINLYRSLINSPFKIAISNRMLRNKFNYTRIRSYASVLMVKIANRVIDYDKPIRDTQCGCKLFEREVVYTCFRDEFISEWLFDIEIFLRLKQLNNYPENLIIEVAVNNMGESKDSKFKVFNNLKVLNQLYQIQKHYK